MKLIIGDKLHFCSVEKGSLPTGASIPLKHLPSCFHKIYKFLPASAKFIHFPISPLFPKKFMFFFLNCVFCFPYFDHDAFMHRA